MATLITREHWESLTDKHPSAPSRTWGAAYHIPPDRVKEVREYLDIREINGYSMHMVDFHDPAQGPHSSSKELSSGIPIVGHPVHGAANQNFVHGDGPLPIKCLVYIGLPDNPQFLGPQDPDALAKHIVNSIGPSGENKEYVYMLDSALQGVREDCGVEEDVDEHVHDLAVRVRREESALSGR